MSIRSSADFGTGLSVRIGKVGYGVSTGSGRGAITGRPVVTLTLVLRNTSSRSISVNTVQVQATYGRKNTPAIPSYGKGTKMFGGAVGRDSSTSGVYQFVIPVADQHDVDLTVWYRAGAPVALLRGSLR